MPIKLRFILLILPLLHSAAAHGQQKNTEPFVTNIQYSTNKNHIAVTYRIENGEENFIYNISGIIIDSSFRKTEITKASGNFGSGIVYHAAQNAYTFDIDLALYPSFPGVYKISLSIEKSIMNKKVGGPSNALLSLALPGLGDHYVYRRKGLGTAFTTVTLGLLTGGISLRLASKKYYKDYNDALIQEDIDSYYEKANSYFKTGNLLLSAAAVVWVADVALVARQGIKNEKEKKSKSASSETRLKNRIGWSLQSNRNTQALSLHLTLTF